MGAFADRLAECVLQAFEALPAKCKPRPRNDGAREWIPLSGIIFAKGNAIDFHSVEC